MRGDDDGGAGGRGGDEGKARKRREKEILENHQFSLQEGQGKKTKVEMGTIWGVVHGFNSSTHRLESCPGNVGIHRCCRCTHHQPIHMGRPFSSNQYHGCMLANGNRPKRRSGIRGESDMLGTS